MSDIRLSYALKAAILLVGFDINSSRLLVEKSLKPNLDKPSNFL